jgi:DNA repair protein RecO (recombination protein O)
MSNKTSIYKTEGIILRAIDLGDLDRLLIIYTRGYGKIQVRAVSAHKKESKLKGLISPFTKANFLLAKSKTIDILTDVEISDNHQYLRSRLVNLSLAFYFAELVDKLVWGSECDTNLWRLIERGFAALNQPRYTAQLAKLKTAFEQKLLEFLGHGRPLKKTALEAIQELAGEEINSYKFLGQI